MLRRYSHWIIPSILLFNYLTTSGAEVYGDKLWLVEDGKPRVTIVGGGDDAYAAERLQLWFSQEAKAKVDVATPAELDRVAKDRCIITLGSETSNPLIGKLAKQFGLKLNSAELSEQGYIARRARHDGRQWIILAGGGRDGVIHAVADLMNLHLNVAGKGAWIGPLDTRQVPRMRYRWFWTWDNRMDWGGAGKIATTMASVEGGAVFRKKPEAFLVDYKRCIDYMADHKFNGLIIWGFLRDSHGGVEASQDLCRYAARRGIRILPGVGTSGYGGYYFEGRNLYSVNDWLVKHPELRAVKKDGTPYAALCPSNPINKKWLDDGAEWLFKTFEIGGVNLEMGDFLVCHCENCKKARGNIKSSEPDYYKDMALSHMVTLEKMRSVAPEAWLSYATYTSYNKKMETDPPKFLSMIPQDAICQWTLTGMARRWPDDVRPMASHNIGYLHWCNISTKTENDFYLQRVHDICRNAAAAGLEGLDTYGELDGKKLNAEIFYLAWEAFLWRPDMTAEEFVHTRLGRIYGGAEAASAWLDIIPLIRTRKARADESNLNKAIILAQAAREISSPAGHKRWDELIGNLQRERQILAERLLGSAARVGRRIQVASVTASDEDRKRGWSAINAIDGSIVEPQGYWLTKGTKPNQAWLELKLSQPEKINRVAVFHQLNAGHYRSMDYSVSVRADGRWKPVVEVKGNIQPGWIGHKFDTVTTDTVRLDITRSAHAYRMGVGEIELRMSDEK